jgi:hypothetical protein
MYRLRCPVIGKSQCGLTHTLGVKQDDDFSDPGSLRGFSGGTGPRGATGRGGPGPGAGAVQVAAAMIGLCQKILVGRLHV